MNAPAIASKTWQTLAAHARHARGIHLRDLFAADPGRFGRFSVEQCGMLLDFSKQRLTAEAQHALLGLWWAADLPGGWSSAHVAASMNYAAAAYRLAASLRNVASLSA